MISCICSTNSWNCASHTIQCIIYGSGVRVRFSSFGQKRLSNHFFWVNQQKPHIKMFSWTQCEISKNRRDWHKVFFYCHAPSLIFFTLLHAVSNTVLYIEVSDRHTRSTLIFTDRVRSTTVRYCFHRCLCSQGGKGYPKVPTPWAVPMGGAGVPQGTYAPAKLPPPPGQALIGER